MFNFLEKITGGGAEKKQREELAELEEREENLRARIKNIEDFSKVDRHRDDAQKLEEAKKELEEIQSRKEELQESSEDES